MNKNNVQHKKMNEFPITIINEHLKKKKSNDKVTNVKIMINLRS